MTCECVCERASLALLIRNRQRYSFLRRQALSENIKNMVQKAMELLWMLVRVVEDLLLGCLELCIHLMLLRLLPLFLSHLDTKCQLRLTLIVEQNSPLSE